MPPADALLLMLEELKPPTAIAKIKNSSHFFVYYDQNKAWSSHKGNEKPELNESTLNIATAAKIINSGSATGQLKHFYISHAINEALKSPFVKKIAPHYIRLAGHNDLSPQLRLWISSENATATWHYDMERNFFTQLTGRKKFVIANSDSYLFLKLHSNLHPSWRQSKYIESCSLQETLDLAIDYVDSTEVLSVACTNSSNFHQNHHRQNPICRYREEILKVNPETLESKIELVKEIFGISEVHLEAGDVFHLPPFFFHCVQSGLRSLSLNSWIGSSEYYLIQKLQNIPLPWNEDSSFSEKVQAIRFTMFRLFQRFGYRGVWGVEYDLFSKALEERYINYFDTTAKDFVANTVDLPCDNGVGGGVEFHWTGHLCVWDTKSELEDLLRGENLYIYIYKV